MGNNNNKPKLTEACYSEVYNRIGTAQSKRKDYKAALRSYRKSVELDPQNFHSCNNLGDILNNQENYDEAAIHYQNAANANPKSSTVYNNLGNTCYNQEKYEDALSHYKQALQLSPDDSKIYSNCGDALYRQKEFREAARYYHKSIRLNSNESDTLNNLGRALYKLGRYEQAIFQYQRALKIESGDAAIYSNLAKAFDKLGKTNESIKQNLRASELDSKNIKTHTRLGLALSSEGRYDEALKHYYKAVELGSTDADTYTNLGLALYSLGKYEKAIGQYLKAIQINPDYCLTLLSWSLSLFSMKRYIEYFRIFAKVAYILEGSPAEKAKMVKFFTQTKSFTQREIIEMSDGDSASVIEIRSRLDALDHILDFLTSRSDEPLSKGKLKRVYNESHSINLKILEISAFFYSKRYYSMFQENLHSILYKQDCASSSDLESLEEMPFPEYKAVYKMNRPDKIFSITACLGLTEAFSDEGFVITEENLKYSQLVMTFGDPSLVEKVIKKIAREFTALRRSQIYAEYIKDYTPKSMKKEMFKQIISCEGDMERKFAACALNDVDIFALACFFEDGVEIPAKIDDEQDVDMFVLDVLGKMNRYIEEINVYAKKESNNLHVISPSRAI